MTVLNSSRSCGWPSLLSVRAAQPTPAQLTATRSAPSSVATSIAFCTSSADGHVGLDEARPLAELLLERRSPLLVAVDDDDARAAGDQASHRRFAEARRTAGHQGYRSLDLHSCPPDVAHAYHTA